MGLATVAAVTVLLTAPGHSPKTGTHWSYSVTAKSGGKPAAAHITAQIVDPIGGVHQVDFGNTTKHLRNWPFKGTFRDFVIWPAELARDPAHVPAHREGRKREEGDQLPRHRAVSPGAAIAVSGVRKSFEGGRVPALRDVSFEVAPGELVALTGASGSGRARS